MRVNKPIIFFITGLLLIFFAQLFEQDKIDWRVTYSMDEKIPFSSYIFYDLLEDFFPKQDLLISENSFYEAVDSADFSGSNWIFINTEFKPDQLDSEEMLNYVEAGNTVFISANSIQGSLADSLKLDHEFHLLDPDTLSLKISARTSPSLFPYNLGHIRAYYHISKYDSLNSAVLGTDSLSQANFIRINRGNGFFLLHSIPMVFTNYHILKGKSLHYHSALLSYLPIRRTIWDEYYKESRVEMSSPLRFILNRSALQWAYYTGMITLILFMIFIARRRQRIIPVIPPLKNDTLDFVKTVSGLYYQHGDHKNMFIKKTTYFMENLRSKLYINEEPFSDEFIRIVASKSGIELEKVTKFFDMLTQFRGQGQMIEAELLHASIDMEKFKNEINMT